MDEQTVLPLLLVRPDLPLAIRHHLDEGHLNDPILGYIRARGLQIEKYQGPLQLERYVNALHSTKMAQRRCSTKVRDKENFAYW